MMRLLALSVLARLPLAMLSIALLVHARQLTGSFAAAGAVTAAYAATLGVGGPLLGRLVDRRGQTGVLLGSAAACAALLAATAALPAGAPVAALVVLAAGVGLATPPVGACLRALIPVVADDTGAAYALDATAVELTFICGPPLALALAGLWSTGAALVAAGLVLLAATAAFAAEPVSRAWRPAAGRRAPGGTLGTPAMRTLVAVLIAVGVLFGAVEVAVTAAARALDGTGAAAPLLALWGAGSLAGGALAARLGGGAHSAAGLALVLAALTAGHLALAAAAGSLLALGALLLVAGAAIAPTYASVYGLVDRAAPSGTVTEAFAWLSTAIALGSALGAAGAGALADHAGPSAGFVLAGAAGAAAVLTTLRLRLPAPTAVAVPAA